MKAQSRRIFIKRSLLALGMMALSRVRITEAVEKKPIAPPAGQTPVLESDPVASAVGYHRNIKNIDSKKYPQRSRPDSKSQFCQSCVNYTAANEAWGKCQILNGLVSAQGWCGSWLSKT